MALPTLTRADGGDGAVFHDRELVALGADSISPAWRKYLTWEVLELAFQHELLETERIIWASNKLHAGESAVTRRDLILSMWDHPTEGPGGRAVQGSGLADEDEERRHARFATFLRILQAWPHKPENLAGKDWSQLSLNVRMQLEPDAWQFYRQTVYDFLGCMATIPVPEAPCPPIDGALPLSATPQMSLTSAMVSASTSARGSEVAPSQ
jgi:hypothetical protein